MNPNFKKKKPLPYKNLGELYIETAYHEPSISRLVSVLLEDINTQVISWEPFEKRLYLTEKLPGNLTGTGPGEYSVAALLLKEVDPKNQIFSLPDTELHTIVATLNNYIQGSEYSYDVKINDDRYEVKQTSDTTSVRTGAQARGIAVNIFSTIKKNIKELTERYNGLSNVNKETIETIKMPDGTPIALGDLLNKSKQYLKVKNVELAAGALGIYATAQERTPKIYLLPEKFLLLLTEPKIKNIVSLTAIEIEKIYNVSPHDAKVIDFDARDYIANKNKDITVSDETKFSDFLLMASESSFSSPEVFNTNILNYFIPGTDEHKEALKEIFIDVTGMYVVSPLGYKYVPRDDFDSVLRISQISSGTLKVILQKQTSNA